MIYQRMSNEMQEYDCNAKVYFRHSTEEWILEVFGKINETDFVSRHTAPKESAPEDVPGLPLLYQRLQKLEEIAQHLAGTEGVWADEWLNDLAKKATAALVIG